MTRALVLALALTDAAIWAAFPGLTTMTRCLAHIGLLASGGCLVWLTGVSRSAPLALVLMACLGPAGAVVAMILQSSNRARARTLAPWYVTLSGRSADAAPHSLTHKLAQGRVPPSGQAAPGPLETIFNTGTRADKYAALRRMARHTKPLPEALLRRALDDADPAIRVQAAALAAKAGNSPREQPDTAAGARKSLDRLHRPHSGLSLTNYK